MEDLSRISFRDDFTSNDDIDELFSHLEQFEPPPDFVKRVMTAVSRLSLPLLVPRSIEGSDEVLVVDHQHISPT